MPTQDQRPFVRGKGVGGAGVSAQRTGESPYTHNSLSAPFPYFGGKSRLAPAIWQRLGNPTVYVEPFAGSLACLLARPDGAGQREIVCDLDGGISNFWRAVTADPDAVAAWADYPTFHADLTARHKWLRAWFAENSAELSNDPHFYCAKVAGWWVWGISLWIGGGWCNATSDRKDGTLKDKRPMVGVKGVGGEGVSAQRINLPSDPQRVWDVRPAVTSGNGVSAQAQRAQKDRDQVPFVHHDGPGGQGVSAQRINLPFVKDKIPKMPNNAGGSGVSAQSSRATQDQRPMVDNKGYGNAVSAQSKQARDQTPKMYDRPGGSGVSAQRTPDKRPFVRPHPGGTGVNAQTMAAQESRTPDKRPYAGVTGGGQGVSAQRLNTPDKMPQVYDRPGGHLLSAQSRTRPDLVSWFRAIQERLKGVIVLNRSWESALTPTLLMHTPTAPKPPVGILLDPPYLTVDRQSELYGSDADGSSSDVATAAYAWAIANGDRFRIAYCCHEGDFPVPDGWTFITASFGGVKDVERRASRQDMVMFSPMCVPDEPDPQMTLL